MEPPLDVSVWTFDTVVNLVRSHDYEPGYFDFKEALNGTNPTHNQQLLDSIRRATCAMANAAGGFLIFGVLDRRAKKARGEDRIVGIALDSDLRYDFGTKVNIIQPSVYWEATQKPILLPSSPSRGIFIVRVPPSLRKPHMVSSSGIYYRRGQGGDAVPMMHDEVRTQLLSGEELKRKVTLIRLELLQVRSTVAMHLKWLKLSNTDILRSVLFDTIILRIAMVDVALLPPIQATYEPLAKVIFLCQIYNDQIESTLSLLQRGLLSEDRVNKSQWSMMLPEIESACATIEGQLASVFGPLPNEVHSVMRQRLHQDVPYTH